MGKTRRRIPVIAVGFGIVFTLIVVIAIVLISSVNRQRVEPKGPEESPDDVTRTGREPGGADVMVDEDSTVMLLDEAPQLKTGYTIAGQVVDEAGRGIAEAEVLICFDARFRKYGETRRTPVARRLKTDADGNFRARDLPKKRLLITATSKDLCYYMPGLQLPLQAPCWYPVTYQPGRDSVTGVRLVLRPGAVIAGTVVDTEGGPVPNAIVTLYFVRDGKLEVAVDATGRFRAENLQPGKYSIRAKAEGFAARVPSPVKAGTEDLVVRLPRTCTVEGVVLLADTGEPVAGAEVRSRVVQADMVSAEFGGEVMGETVETDPDGLFKVSVLPGMDTELSASWKGYYSKTKPTVHAEADWPAQPVTIELVKGAIVSGTVLDDETDAPVPGVRVRAQSRTSRRGAVLTESGEEGRFTLVGLAEGENVVHAWSDEYDFANPSPGEGSLLVEVVEGEDQSGIELRVAKKPAIAAKIVDEEGEPIFGALVVLKEGTNRSGQWSMYPTGSGFSEGDGTFVMRRRIPGRPIMGLLVSHPLYANTYVSFEPDGVTSGTKEVVVVLKKTGASIEGTIRDESGELKEPVTVELLDTTPIGFAPYVEVRLKSVLTDEEGRYVLSPVADGTYRVKASLGERAVVSGAVPIVEGKKVTGVDLALPALGHIAGRVTDDQDQPLAGLRVRMFRRRGGTERPDVATDSDGRYRFDGLVDGEQCWVSVYEKPGLLRVGPEWQVVTCSADDIDFTFKAVELGTVSGFVYQEPDGSPVTQFRLSVSGKENGAASVRTFHSEDGSFSFADVAAGLSTIEVWVYDLPGGAGRVKHRTEPFEVVAGEEVVQIVYLPETGTVRGSVRRASDGSPVTEFRLSLDRAQGRRWRPEPPYAVAKEYKSEEGLFQCEDLKPGQYAIRILAEGLPNFRSEPFEVTAGAEAVQEILIGEGGVIRGVVVDESGHPVQDAVVEVVPRAVYSKPPRDTTDKRGEFELTGVTPGKVTLRVTHADYAPIEVRDLAVSEDAPVEDLEIKLERGSVVFGWVKDSDGELRGGVELRLNGQESKNTRTDYRGRYRFEHVPVGTYRLTVSYLGASLPNFEVKGVEDTEINIDFAEAGTISGTIHAPPEGDEVRCWVRLEGRDKAAGVSRRVELHGKDTFKFEGVFPGKYKLDLDAYRKNDEGRYVSVNSTTDPREIIIEVAPKEHVTQDITITKIEERE